MKITNYNLFPSLVTHTECEDFYSIRNDLIDWIYSYKKETNSVSLSNRGGWQSPSDFYANNQSFNIFYDYILGHISRSLTYYDCKFKLLNMWINVNHIGNYNALHNHPLSHISGAFWIKCLPECGNFVFHNGSSFAQHPLLANVNGEVRDNTNYSFKFHFKPSEGSILLFPSDLMHEVEENKSDGDRISISFNLSVI